MKGFRKERVGEVILVFVADQLRRLTDPRLANVTLTDIDVTPDLKVAHIYWTTHNASLNTENGVQPKSETSEERKQVQEALVGITKLLKTRIGKELKLRYTPHLDFQFDDSVAKGFYIEELLQKA